MQELECWKTLAATEVAEVIFAVEAQESTKKPEEKNRFFDREILSMIEVFSGRPEGDDLYAEEITLIESIRMRIMLKTASLSCTMKHVDYLYHLEDLLDAVR